MLTLILNGEVYSPEPLGVIDVLVVGDEIAISDQRAAQPELRELEWLVVDAHVGGMLSRKCGVTHFHAGDDEKRLEMSRF